MALATAAPVPLSILSSLFHCHILVFLLQQGQGWAVSLHLPPLLDRTGCETEFSSNHQ